jgi:hypothetical protein
MRVDFDFGRQDLEQFNRFHMRHSPTARSVRRWGYWACPAAALVPLVVFRQHGLAPMLGGALAAALVSWALIAAYWRFGVGYVIRRSCNEGDGRGLFGPHSLELTPEGIHETTAVSTSTYAWTGIERIADDDSHLYLYVSPTSAYVVPKRAFASAEGARTFLAQASAYRHASRG